MDVGMHGISHTAPAYRQKFCIPVARRHRKSGKAGRVQAPASDGKGTVRTTCERPCGHRITDCMPVLASLPDLAVQRFAQWKACVRSAIRPAKVTSTRAIICFTPWRPAPTSFMCPARISVSRTAPHIVPGSLVKRDFRPAFASAAPGLISCRGRRPSPQR